MSNGTDPGHGNSPASWTAVTVILIAFVIGTFAFWFDQPWLVWGAAGLAVLGLIVGWIMKAVGYGVGGHRVQTKSH